MDRKWFAALLIPWLLLLSLHAGAVEYALPDLDGKLQSLKQYRGKWVIVNYWATWCGTCKKELPDLVAFHQRNKERGAVVVGVNFEDITTERLREYVTRHAMPFLVLRSELVPVTPLGRVPALPTTYIIDPNGKVVAGEVGLVTTEQLEEYIEQKKSLPEYTSQTPRHEGDV